MTPRMVRSLPGSLLAVMLLVGSLWFAGRAFAGATVTNGIVTLSWDALADPNSADDSSYTVARTVTGVSGSVTWTVPKTTTSTTDSNVTNGTTYNYRVYFSRTTHDFHADADGVVRDHPTTAQVTALDTTADVQLAAPALSGSTTSGYVDLTWIAVPNATGVYSIYRSADGAAFTPTNAYATTANNVQTYRDINVFNGHTYAYYVQASNNAGRGDASNTQTLQVTLAAPSLSGSTTNGFVDLSWNAVPNATGAYSIYRSVDGAAFSPNNAYATTPNNTQTFHDTGVSNGHTYAYYVQASNNAGRGDASNTQPVTVTLAAPALSGSTTNGFVDLAWNGVPNATGSYSIYRSVDGAAFSPNNAYATVANSGRTFRDSSVVNGHAYAYYVQASNNGGRGDASNTQSIYVDLAAPGLNLSQASDGLLLQWNAVPNATGLYSIYRSVDGAAFALTNAYANPANSTLAYKDTNVFAGHLYAYCIKASNNAFGGQLSVVRTGELSPVEPNSTAGAPWQCACSKVAGGDNVPEWSAFFTDPVNVATGGETIEPGPDLTVYNPAGPQVAFQRVGRGNQAKRGYGSPGLPVGWVHTYDAVLQGPTSPSAWTDTLTLGYAIGANEPLNPQVDGSGQPTGAFTTSPGVPYFVQGVPSTTVGRWQSITLTWADRTRWEFTPYNTGTLYALTRIYDRMGNSITLTYTNVTRCLTAVRNTATNAALLTLTYGNNGLLSAVADCYGRKVVYTTGSLNGTTTLASVSQVAAAATSSPPARFSYLYQSLAGSDGVAQPYFAGITVPSATGTGSATATISYDAQNRVSVLTDSAGSTRSFVYQGGGTWIQDRDASGTLLKSYRLNYDSLLRNTGITLADATTTTVVNYDDSGNLRQPTSVVAPDGKTVSCTYDSYGNVLTATSARNIVTTYTYDYNVFPLGRLISVQEAGKPATTFAYYEPSGLLQSVTSPSPAGGTVTRAITYDALGNVLTVTGPGNNATTSATVTFNYTQDGTYTQAAALGQALTMTDPLNRVVHLRYDAQGRPISATDAAGNTATVQYNLADQPVAAYLPATGQSGSGSGHSESVYLYPDGPLTATKLYDEAGALIREVDYTYDSEGRTLTTTGSTEPVRFEYDGVGRLVHRYDGNNNLQTEYLYNALGYLATERRPQGGGVYHSRSYFYDVAGRVIQRVDGVDGSSTGQIVANYAYDDPEGLLTAVQYPATPGRNVALTYDSFGRLSSRTDGTGTQAYTYGDLDQVLTATTTYAGLPAQMLSYGYYPDGSRASLTTPVGSFSYQYNAAGQPTSLTNPFSETTGWTYYSYGWLASQVLSNGANTGYTYNALGQLTALLNRDGSNNTLSQFNQMVHDGAGNRLSVTASVPGVTALSGGISYLYDTKDQLQRETSALNGGFVSNFGYDGAGNPTTFQGLARSYDLQNRRADTGFAYDVQGNPTLYKGTSIAYTPEGGATQFGTLLSADYTAEGLRAWKQSGATGIRTYFVYDGATPVLELNASGAVTAVNTFGTNGLVSRRTVTVSGAQSVFYQFDERGNTSQRLDASGAVLSSHAADAFGGTVAIPSGAGTDDPYAGYGAQWGYYRDAETGLYLCTFRYYDPTEGRWLTPDPSGYSGGVNLYGYVKNAPSGSTDPSGLDQELSGTERAIIDGFGHTGTILGGAAGFIDGGGLGAVSGFGVASAATAPAGALLGASLGAAGGLAAGRILGVGVVYGSRAIAGLLGSLSKSRGNAGKPNELGNYGESKLRDMFPRGSKGRLPTPSGFRNVDWVFDGVAHESKVGYVCADGRIRTEISKDLWLLAKGRVREVVWHFFKNPNTGIGGPSAEVRALLNQSGIRYIIHP